MEHYGITVINDASEDARSESLGVGIAVIARMKHAALHEASKVLGSASALARHLGIHVTEIGRWINLQECPPAESGGKRWTDSYLLVMETKLFELTGKTWEELWPESLRQNKEFLGASKVVERVFNMEERAMLEYASATTARLTAQQQVERADSPLEMQKEAIDSCLHLLPLRDRKVLAMRFGIGQKKKTLRALAKELKISTERVRAIEQRALKRLQKFASLKLTKLQEIT